MLVDKRNQGSVLRLGVRRHGNRPALHSQKYYRFLVISFHRTIYFFFFFMSPETPPACAWQEVK